MQDAKLQQIVQRMVEAGESEEDIALVIREYKPKPAPAPSVAAPRPMSGDRPLAPTEGTVAVGIGKGLLNTAIGMGELAYNYVPAVRALSDSMTGGGDQFFDEARKSIQPASPLEKVGFVGEQMAEFFVPGAQAEKLAASVASKLPKYTRLLPKMGAQSAANAGMAEVQGNNTTTAAVTGAAVPVVGGAVGSAVRWVGSKAEPLVRSAIKPTVSSMRKIAGASADGLDAKAEQLVTFIIDNKVTTPQKAVAIMSIAEGELKALLASKNAPTDAAERALRYLQGLERSAQKQGLAADDVAVIRNAAAELLEGRMGEDIVTMVPKPHPTLLGPNGQPVTVLVPEVTRQLRATVPADEALEAARASSQWSTRKQWGEQKGARMEAEKAVERAERDAVKVAVPEAKPLLQREGMAKQARDVLDRMQLRAGNRDAMGLPASIIAAAEVSHGKIPLTAFAANWLRNNQLKSGMWAHALRKAVERNDVRTLATAFERLGIAIPPNVEGYSPAR